MVSSILLVDIRTSSNHFSRELAMSCNGVVSEESTVALFKIGDAGGKKRLFKRDVQTIEFISAQLLQMLLNILRGLVMIIISTFGHRFKLTL